MRLNRVKLPLTLLSIISFLLIFSSFTTLEDERSKWDDDRYAEVNFKQFFELAEANERIDLLRPDYALLDAAIFYASNEIRKKEGRSILRFNKNLRKSSQFHTQTMIEKMFFAHESPVKKMKHPHDRITNFGGPFTSSAENLAKLEAIVRKPNDPFAHKVEGGYLIYYNPKNNKKYMTYTYGGFARACIKAWMRSPGHKKNLMLRNVTHLGCGGMLQPVVFQKGEVYVLPMLIITQNFGG